MERVEEARAIEGDRYCEGSGFWTPYGDVCEVTLISSGDLDDIESDLGISVRNGEHRRNIVTRGIDLSNLRREWFRIGGAILEYERLRPPCRHVEDVSEPGMRGALRGRGGLCARVVEGGMIRTHDVIEIV